ncbi:hypothetical protein F5Y17DRAFT_320026 [Xylariaceae sp. FL0594]|nr:hypothetical protein F5Y17DRAFT_320026 [Xylariaceae sp. FL0594]
MVHIPTSSLFHKRSKGSISSNKLGDPSDTSRKHARKWSSSSTLSHTSSSASSYSRHTNRPTPHGYNPLSLHPPLRLNTSPHVIPEYEYEHDMARYQEDEEREVRFFHQTRYAEDHIQDLAEYSPVKGENCYFHGSTTKPFDRHTYTYDQDSQWPLKDWQPIPPGLSDSSSSSSSQSSSAATSPTQSGSPPRRNADWMNDTDVFVKRGAWKRQGVVFHLNEQDEEFQEKHFELPE